MIRNVLCCLRIGFLPEQALGTQANLSDYDKVLMRVDDLSEEIFQPNREFKGKLVDAWSTI